MVVSNIKKVQVINHMLIIYLKRKKKKIKNILIYYFYGDTRQHTWIIDLSVYIYIDPRIVTIIIRLDSI